MPSENVFIYERGRKQDRVGAQEDMLIASGQYQESKKLLSSPDAESTQLWTSYSGCDIRAIVSFYDDNATDEESKVKFKTLGDIQTLTYSTHREKFPVRTLGRTGTKGYTRGPRTIGGTLIFTVFNKEVLSDMLVQNYQLDSADADNYGVWKAVLIDQIPPFDITVNFVNEYGSASRLVLYGVELVNEGQTMSIDDLITENVVNFVARHIQPMYDIAAGVDSFEDYAQIEVDFEKLMKDVRVRRLLAAMEKPQPKAKKAYSKEEG